MKPIITILLLLMAMPVYAADRGRGRRDEETARQGCMEQARATRHNVNSVRSVRRNGGSDYTVEMRVQGVRDSLMCHYDVNTGGAELVWAGNGGSAYGSDWNDRDWRWSGGKWGEDDARRACMEQAQATRHNVTGTRSVSKDGPNSYTLALRVQGVNQPLICHYDQGNRTAQLEWPNAGR